MAKKISAADVSAWVQVVLQLVSVGVTTVTKVKAAMVDAGWSADDARLLSLQAQYDARIARRQAEQSAAPNL